MKFAAVARWLHIYTSVLGLAAVLFFSVTGLTLNHPDWMFGSVSRQQEYHGQFAKEWLSGSAGGSMDKLQLAEFLRRQHGLHGTVEEFHEDDPECSLAFKGPGYSADVFFDRHTGNYDVTEASDGWLAVLNDLHKGRHTGARWSVVIDVSAVLLIVVSATGLILLFFLKRRRVVGSLLALLGTAVVILAAWLLVE